MPTYSPSDKSEDREKVVVMWGKLNIR